VSTNIETEQITNGNLKLKGNSSLIHLAVSTNIETEQITNGNLKLKGNSSFRPSVIFPPKLHFSNNFGGLSEIF
jgi:hypothetical protein